MRKTLLTMLAAVALAACGGGDDDSFRDPGTSPGTGGGGGGGSGPEVAALTVSSSTPSIPSDGSAVATITAFARDANNNLLPNVSVTFVADSGGIAGSPAVTDENGAASVTLSTAGDPTPRTITVTASVGSLSATVSVQVVASGGSTTVQMGSGTGANFQPGVIAISNPNLSAGGSTSLQVVLQQSDGSLYTQDAQITFSSPCAAQGLATITSPVSTNSGIASATYAATGCSGEDVITATTNVGGSALSASGTVTVAAAAIGSIVFESATPSNIALKGTGDTGRPETSTVVFRVLDQSGGPRAGATVEFALNTAVGGITLSPTSAQTDSTGRVQTIVQSGTVATSVRVTATVTSTTPTISTQSSQLTVTTGIPDQNSFSLSVQCPNVEAWDRDGVTVPVTARLADRFNNPVPDGTAVTFTTEGGSIQSQCVTTTTATESGVCTVNWVSSNPRPVGGPGQSGRSTVMATAIGEESFIDANGNGAFDDGELFDDLPERFLDENENRVYDPGERFYDFNNNGIRDDADGIFNGVLCFDTTGRCDPNRRSTGISASNLIIMSGSTPAGVQPPNGDTLPAVTAGGSRTYSFLFADLNGNPLPSGTTISASVVGNGLSLGTPSSFTVPCTTEPTVYPISVSATASATSGSLTITVKTPSGVESLLSYPVPVM